MSGVRKSKAKKMQAAASEATGRTRKGRNKVPTISRQDKKKGADNPNRPRTNRSH
jgi:hypothetical protein